VWRLATEVHGRKGWTLTSTYVHRSWEIEATEGRFNAGAFVSAFLEGPRGPGFVFNLQLRSLTEGHERLIAMPWFRTLQRRLGRLYKLDEHAARRGETHLIRILRGTTAPHRVLRIFSDLRAAVEARKTTEARTTTRRTTDERCRADADAWTIARTLRRGGWRVESIAHAHERESVSDGRRWIVSATFSALASGAKGEPGFVGLFDAWPIKDLGRSGTTPAAPALRLLRRAGHRVVSPGGDHVHTDRFERGLTLAAARRELRMLEQAVELSS
jgi:hypothetical protein